MLYFQTLYRAMRKVGKESCYRESCLAVKDCSFSYKFDRAVVLTKFTRLEYYRLRHDTLNERELEEKLRSSGTDYDSVVKNHTMHKNLEQHFKSVLVNHGIETRVANRFTYSDEFVSWADVVFSVGGDGTFLLAASRIRDTSTMVIGINTDPVRSEGRLCLPDSCTKNFDTVVKRLMTGDFNWMYRSRIRVSLSGNTNHLRVSRSIAREATSNAFFDCTNAEESMSVYPDTKKETERPRYQTPVLALNEAFMAEKLSARVSHFSVNINDNETPWKVKSSGLCVSTGTGSTSWHLSMNRITGQTVQEILKIMSEDGIVKTDTADTAVADEVATKYNQALISPVSSQQMYYTFRDIIFADVWPEPKDIHPRGAAQRMEVTSVCLDGSLVVDGLISMSFDEGTTAHMEIYPEDSLRCMTVKEFIRDNEY